MTKCDAPLTFFGSGLPAGSVVFLKSRFRLYSASPILPKLTTDHADSTDFKTQDGHLGRSIFPEDGGRLNVEGADIQPAKPQLFTQRVEPPPQSAMAYQSLPTLHSAAARRRDSERTGG